MLKGDDFHRCTYMVCSIKGKEFSEVIPSVPEQLADYILRHKNDNIVVTNEYHDVLLTANKGIITSCVDDDYLKNELQPAIDNYDNYKKLQKEIYDNIFGNKELIAHENTDTETYSNSEQGSEKEKYMNYNDFKTYINAILPNGEKNAESWLEWAKELERMDSDYGELPKGEYKTAENFLAEFVNHMQKAHEKYGVDVVKQIISLADMSACTFPWEMDRTAKYLANGGNIKDIPEMERNGTLEETAGESMQDDELEL